MNAIEIIKQNAKMWLGPKYSNKEYEIFKEGIEPLCKRLIKEIRKANNEENKAPRTGFPKPTEKEKKEFEKLFPKITINPELLKKLYKPETLYVDKEMAKLTKSTFPQLFSEKVPQSFFYCPIHKRTKLTKFKSKEGNDQVCIKCNPKLIK